MNQNGSTRNRIQKLTIAAVLTALSLVLMSTIRFSVFPSAPFYEMEFSDVPILVCSAVLGPIYSIVSLFIVCLIQTLFFSTSSGFIGFVMHFVSSGLMILVVWIIRSLVRGFKGVVLSDICGVIVMTLAMIPLNMWMVSIFMGSTATEFLNTFLGVCVAFNVIKASSNLVIYSILTCKISFNKNLSSVKIIK